MGGLIYTGLVEKTFKIPLEHRLYLFKKMSNTEKSHPQEIENEFETLSDGSESDDSDTLLETNQKKMRRLFLYRVKESNEKIKIGS